MASKKTISVIKVIDYANDMLDKDYFNKATKEGIICMLEKILMDTDNYNGFHFLDNEKAEINTVGHVSRKYYKPRK